MAAFREADQVLAQQLRLGDVDAQEQLHRTLAPRLRATATHFLGWNDPDIDDVVQMAFLSVFENLDRYDPDRASLYTWVNRICVFHCFKRLRSRKRMVFSLSKDLRAADATDGDDEAAQLEMLHREMDRLEEPCRGLVRQRVRESKSYVELSESLAMPMGTIASRLARCLRTLRDRIRKED